MLVEKRFILRNISNSDLYLQDFKPIIIIKGNSPSKKQFTATEINSSQDINIFITNGMLEPIEVSEDFGALVNSQINTIHAQAPAKAIRRDFRKEGIMVRDGIVSSMGTEELGESNILIPGTRVRLKGSSALVGTLGEFSEKMGRWEMLLDDGRRAFAMEQDIIDLDLGVSSHNIDGERKVIYAEDVLKRGVVGQREQLQRAGTLYAGDIIGRVARGQQAINLAGAPLQDSDEPGGRFKAAEVINRPLTNDGKNVDIIFSNGAVPARRPEMEDNGTVIVEGEGGFGEEVSMNKVVQDTGKVMGQRMSHAIKKAEAKAVEKSEEKKTKYQLKKERRARKAALEANTGNKESVNAMPEIANKEVISAAELAEFFSKPIHIQKFGISKMKNLVKLEAIAENAENDNIAMLAMERLTQLKG